METEQKNICKKYEITNEELNQGIERVIELACKKISDVKVLVAITELLVEGDITNKNKE